MLDAVVIGAGPNGLVAATVLARAGVKTLVLEASSEAGGAVRSAALTEPGFIHDLGAAFFPFGEVSPAFRALNLEGVGLRFLHAPIDSAHPAVDGSCGIIARDLPRTCRELGVDGPAWLRLARWRTRMGDDFVRLITAPLPLLGPAMQLGLGSQLRFLRAIAGTGRGFARRTFRTPGARRMIPQLSLHADVGPRDFMGASMGLVLGLLAGSAGFPVAEGGSASITRALLRRLAEAGASLRLSSDVERVIVSEGSVKGVRLRSGEEIETRLVLADTSAPTLCLELVGPADMPPRLVRRMSRFPQGWGTFKLDWSLDGPVPWLSNSAHDSAVVHLGGDLEELDTFTREVRAGQLPTHPYLVLGQQSLVDTSRAPRGKQTLWAYSHVPSHLEGGWSSHREAFADRVEAEIERHAPGFRTLLRKREIHAPPDLEELDANLTGGDLGGGSARAGNLFFLRPAFPYFRHRFGVKGLYLASSYAHPGAGVHGACGYNAAQIALRDLS